jgi:hypothetical protein
VHKRTTSEVKGVQVVSDGISYIKLGVPFIEHHVQTQDKINDVKDSLYEQLELIFNIFTKHHKKILIQDLIAKVGIFKPTNGNENLNEIINDNGIRIVNFATSKNLIVKIRI